MHESAAGQDTQKSWPVSTRGFGLGVIDQPAPEALQLRLPDLPTTPPFARSKRANGIAYDRFRHRDEAGALVGVDDHHLRMAVGMVG